MLAVDAELRAGGVGGSVLAESFANVLAVHLIRHTTGSRRLKAPTDGVLPRHKLRRVIEYIMENLESNPTLAGMAAVVDSSPYHFARQFKAATGLAPHQFLVTRRIERAQHLLRTNGGLGLAEVAFRSGFANQSHFCFNFKRVSESAETVSDFRKNLSNIRKIIKDIGKQPCSLPCSTQVNPIAPLKHEFVRVMLASRLSHNQKIGFSGIVLPLVNSHFYEAKKRCHDDQLQHLS
jgi:AraC-like DNA-binding protein